jgi:hypothetical protein
MTFKANRPFKLKLNGKAKTIAQGQTFNLDDDAGIRLLAKAPDLVTTVLVTVAVGDVVRWQSPLFGVVQGPVLLAEGESLLIDHPTLGEPAWISRDWVI